MLKELFDRIQQTAICNDLVFDSADRQVRLVAGELREFEKDPPARSIGFGSIESFCEYLTDRAGENVEVRVSSDRVFADLEPYSNLTDNAQLPLTHSSELKALTRLGSPVPVTNAFCALRADLCDAFDPRLLAAVSDLQLSDHKDSDWRIDAAGLKSGSTKRTVRLTSTRDGKPVEVEALTDWQWEGRFFECSDTLYTIDVILQAAVSKDGELMIALIPKRMNVVLRQAKQDLVTSIREHTPTESVSVYVG